jgi:hypothetical protein
MMQCWKLNANDRIYFKELLDKLTKMCVTINEAPKLMKPSFDEHEDYTTIEEHMH